MVYLSPSFELLLHHKGKPGLTGISIRLDAFSLYIDFYIDFLYIDTLVFFNILPNPLLAVFWTHIKFARLVHDFKIKSGFTLQS